ncbi:hypothetical protein TWF751_007653 [Orbilia oligospora]|nr:hypothetical protein TWF751_007653 [Orbilia oligospora]
MRIWERMEQNVHIKSPAHAGLGYSSKSSTGLDWESPLALRRWTCLGLLPVYSPKESSSIWKYTESNARKNMQG